MSEDPAIARHYTHGELEAAIRDALVELGKSPGALKPHDLAPVDEFHIGGREATINFAETFGVAKGMRLLDIGSGIGGASRYFAHQHDCSVSGIDLTAEYVEVASTLAQWVGLDGKVDYHHGSALEPPFDDGSFDGAYMMHVGMNIADKEALCTAIARILKPGGRFGIYDVMRVGDGDLAFPVPWASNPSSSHVADPADYRMALEAAGLQVVAETSRSDFAVAFFNDLRAKVAASGGPPPLGLHILMGADAPAKVSNMIANLEAGLIAPTELIAEKPA